MKRKLLYFEILRKEKKKEPFRPGSVIGLISKGLLTDPRLRRLEGIEELVAGIFARSPCSFQICLSGRIHSTSLSLAFHEAFHKKDCFISPMTMMEHSKKECHSNCLNCRRRVVK